MNPLRSVGAKLSLALLLCVTAALGLVYAAVAPSLESRLIDSRLNDLEGSAPALAQQILATEFLDRAFYDRAGTTTNSRVVLLRPLSRGRETWTLGVLEDSSSGPIRDDPLAVATARDLKQRSDTVSRGGERFAEVAVPVGDDGTVLLLSASLDRALWRREPREAAAAHRRRRRARARVRRRLRGLVGVRAPDPQARTRGRAHRERACSTNR